MSSGGSRGGGGRAGLAAALLVGAAGCRGDARAPGRATPPPPSSPAGQRTPAGEAFSAVADGFEIAPLPDGSQRRPARALRAALPRGGDGAIRFEAPSGFSVEVRELEASGEGALHDGAVVYARRAGKSLWTAQPHGYEEWLFIDADADKGPSVVVAAWEVEGAPLRARGDAIVIADAAGAPRIEVTAPRAYTASLRPVGVRLAARGSRIELRLEDAPPEEAVFVDPEWTLLPSMSSSHWFTTAHKLTDGRVLVAGGKPSGAESVAELYDPRTRTWRRTKTEMNFPHVESYVAARLCDGRVLVAGSWSVERHAEVYDPLADTWTRVAGMRSGHTYGTGTLLDDCRVLATGGYDALDLSEVYDPIAERWSASQNALQDTRFYHTATKLLDGRVLVAGGGYQDSGRQSILALVDIYDPASASWAPARPMKHARVHHTATLLRDGRVLVVGGSQGRVFLDDAQGVPIGFVEIYDPTTGEWTDGPPLAVARGGHTATLLENGAVLVVGGIDEQGLALAGELYDGVRWLEVPPLHRARSDHTATLLDDGAVLIAGGRFQATAELFRLDPDGTACSDGATCKSGFCADGVCCASSCADGCRSCSVPGLEGRCVVPCDKSGTIVRTCADGSARCLTSATCEWVSCAPYLCDQDQQACGTTCTSASDCASGFACDLAGRCVRRPDVAGGNVGICTAGARPGERAALSWLAALIALFGLVRRRRRATRN